MADQSTCHPLEYIPDLAITLIGIIFVIGVIVLREADSTIYQPMILGRPWLRSGKVKQHWDKEKDYIKIEHEEEIIKIRTRAVEDDTPSLARVCTLNWAEEEEETYLNYYPSLTSANL